MCDLIRMSQGNRVWYHKSVSRHSCVIVITRWFARHIQSQWWVIWYESVEAVMCDWDHTMIHSSATHCNTLQHTATHCNTLQHTATHNRLLRSHDDSLETFRVNLVCDRGMPRHFYVKKSFYINSTCMIYTYTWRAPTWYCAYSQLQIGWQSISRLFLKTFDLIPGVPGSSQDSSFITWY